MSGPKLDADQIAHGPGRPLILGHNQLEWAVVHIEWLAIYTIRDDDFARMEAWIDLTERQY